MLQISTSSTSLVLHSGVDRGVLNVNEETLPQAVICCKFAQSNEKSKLFGCSHDGLGITGCQVPVASSHSSVTDCRFISAC